MIINGSEYEIAKTRGGDPSLYSATSFTGQFIDPAKGPVGLSFTQNGNYIIAILELKKPDNAT